MGLMMTGIEARPAAVGAQGRAVSFPVNATTRFTTTPGTATCEVEILDGRREAHAVCDGSQGLPDQRVEAVHGPVELVLVLRVGGHVCACEAAPRHASRNNLAARRLLLDARRGVAVEKLGDDAGSAQATAYEPKYSARGITGLKDSPSSFA